MSTKISVIIPVYNSEKTLYNCLKSIYANSFDNFEVIIVDDVSADKTCEVAGRFPCRLIRLDENSGPAYARQAGVAAAEGEIIAFTDSDCVVPPDWLANIYKKLTPDIAGIGGKYIFPERINLISRLIITYWDIKNIFYSGQHKMISLYGGNCAFWKSILVKKRNKMELTHCNKRVGGDDTMLCYELQKFGKIMYDPDIFVMHDKTISFNDVIKETISLGYSGAIVARLCAGSLIKEPQRMYKTFLYMFSLLLAAVTIILPFSHTAAKIFLPLFLIYIFGVLPLSVLVFRSIKQKSGVILLPFITFASDIMNFIGHLRLIKDVLKRKIKNLVWYIKFTVNFLAHDSITRVILFITKQCNARCDFCFNKDTPQSGETDLSVDEVSLITEKGSFLPWLTITGGEPFLRKDLHHICLSFYNNCGTRKITIVTNGSLPSIIESETEKMLIDMPNVHLTVAVALDHINENHDRIKRLEGCYENAAISIRVLNELKSRFPRLTIGVNTILINENAEHVLHIADHFRKSFKFSYHAINPLRAAPRRPISDDKYIRSLKEVNRKLASKKSLQQAFLEECCDTVYKSDNGGFKPCTAVSKFVVIDNDGTVFPCELIRESMGSLRENNYNLRILKNGKQAKHIKEKIRKTKCYCQWPCAVTSNTAFNLRTYPRMLRRMFPDKIFHLHT